MGDKPRYARNVSRSIYSRRLSWLEVRDTSEVGERDCESLPRVVKSRELLRRRRKTKKPKEREETRPDSGRERDGGG